MPQCAVRATGGRHPALPNPPKAHRFASSRWVVVRSVAARCLLASFFGLALAAGADSRPRTLLILHTNDIHGHVENAARFAAHFRERKATRDDVLIVDAGDAITGTPLSSMFEGLPIFEITSAMGYDVAALGNHEFDHGWRRIAAFREAASYPLLAANVRAPNGELIADAAWTVRRVNGIDVGLIGVLTEKTARMIIRKGNEGVSFEPAREALRRLVPEVRAQADIVVVLSHVGHEEELALAEEVEGIDVIIGGHSHTLLEEPAWSGTTIVTQAHHSLKQLGWLYLRVDTESDRMFFIDGGFSPASEQPPPDAEVQALVERHQARLGKSMERVLGVAQRHYGREEIKRWVKATLRRRAGVPLAFYNRGGIRADIPAGEVTVGHLWRVEPFGRNLVTMQLTGAQLRKLLEGEEDALPEGLSMDATYPVATDAFLAGRTVAPELVRDLGVKVRDVLIEAMEDTGLPSDLRGAPRNRD